MFKTKKTPLISAISENLCLKTFQSCKNPNVGNKASRHSLQY